MSKKMSKDEILRVLKRLKDGESVNLQDLPDLTPNEQAVFDSRDTTGALERMLRERGIIPSDD